MNTKFRRQCWCASIMLLLALALTATSNADERPATQPALAQQAAKRETQPAIPLIYASKDGKPFPDVQPAELARITKRAGELAPPGREIWFILVRNGSWFPAAEVYCTPEKADGRVCSGKYAMIWRADAEGGIENLRNGNHWDDYVWVVEPNTPAPKIAPGNVPPIPKTNWLPFHRRSMNDDKLILSLVDTVQAYRKQDKDGDAPEPNIPIMEIEPDHGNYNVLVAWPDQGYETFCIVKATDKGFEAVGWNTEYH